MTISEKEAEAFDAGYAAAIQQLHDWMWEHYDYLTSSGLHPSLAYEKIRPARRVAQALRSRSPSTLRPKAA